MSQESPTPDDAQLRRDERRAALVAALTVVNQARRATMSAEEFDRMIGHMAEQQLIYEEFGSEPR